MAGGCIMDEVLPVSVTVLLPTRNEEEALGATVDAIPRDWCKSLEIMIVDGSSTDRTREIALEKDVRVHLEPRKGYGRAYRTGFVVASNDIIVTMDADCTYPAELIPELVKRLLDDDLDFITCDRLSMAEDGSMSGLHGFGNWVLSFNARLLFGYGIKDSQSGMWVFRKSIFDNPKMRPTNDGMPLSEEIKILARKHLGRKKAIEISVPYRERVGEAEIHTWGDGWKNLRFLYAKRFGLHRTRTEWGPLDDNPDSLNGTLPEQ
jgi:glycosyltransferase involved in cell wall biosynthesis